MQAPLDKPEATLSIDSGALDGASGSLTEGGCVTTRS